MMSPVQSAQWPKYLPCEVFGQVAGAEREKTTTLAVHKAKI